MFRSVKTLSVGGVAVALMAAAALSSVAVVSPATALPAWAPAATAAIHPGVQTFTAGSQCTANFVFSDGSAVYIGQAAHCSGTGGNTATDGCTSGTLPVGTPVTVTGASKPGTMVYNSWATMQANGEADADTCAYNDLALIRLDPADFDKVNPSIPVWGGPVAPSSPGTAVGDFVYSSGNSELRLGLTQLSPKKGVSLGDSGGGWTHAVYTITPGIPGDSGSAFLDANGRALGVLSTLSVAPTPLSNNVGDIGKEVAYMHAHGGPGASLVAGTQGFNGNQLPLG